MIRAAGAEAVSHYGSAEAGYVGHGCLAGETSDDLHLFQDLHAAIQPDPNGTEPAGVLPSLTLLVSSLRPTAPLVLLNVSMGDQATLVERACGCPLDALGWSTHLHTLSSYEKLTDGDMTFADADIVRVLEEVLPARFGGGPTDYQLVEEETERGRPRLYLLIHPQVGPVDPAAVIDTLLRAIGQGSGVEPGDGASMAPGGPAFGPREPPRTTDSGKFCISTSSGGADPPTWRTIPPGHHVQGRSSAGPFMSPAIRVSYGPGGSRSCNGCHPLTI